MRLTHWSALAAAALVGASVALADTTLDAIEGEGMARAEEGRAAQASVDTVHADTRDLIDEYRAELKLVDGLETYIGMLDEQLDGQQREVATLQQSIGDVAVIERQILPLMARMIDALEAFVELDMPFLLEERRERVAKLRGLLRRSDVTVAEKARRVFEAYQIENDYGRTIEAYKAKLELAGASFDADFLRVGRVGLVYQTVGTGDLGFWDGASESWQPLDGVPYRRFTGQGLKVARQEIAPELVSIPLNSTQVKSR
jgi:hypothetical protein